MDELTYIYIIGAIIVGLVLSRAFRPGFDPFEPLWIFLTGYFQLYVVQALVYHDYAMRVRGVELVTAGNSRALWGLLWFLAVYHCGLGKWLAARLPAAPRTWSTGLVLAATPVMIAWGLLCAGLVMMTVHSVDGTVELSAETGLFLQFPLLMLVAANVLIVTGRQPDNPRPAIAAAGLFVAFAYMMIWMFWGRRSHALFAVLTSVCSFYLPRMRRPHPAVLVATAVSGAMVVALAIGWRNNDQYERSFAGFTQYLSEFDPTAVGGAMNLGDDEATEQATGRPAIHETEEYCAYLLILDTVPAKSEHDYGASYIRLVSTYIPRIVWHDKPIFGREQWVNAWIAGSEMRRDSTFTGPSIGILGACQLNGGALGTALVLAVVALLQRIGYDYYRFHAATPWAQAWWAVTFYNAWLMTVNDDPFIWFYYLYGHTTLPPMAFFWIANKLNDGRPSPARS